LFWTLRQRETWPGPGQRVVGAVAVGDHDPRVPVQHLPRGVLRVQQLTSDGRGQVAAIVGEAGVGKSRIVYEVSRSHRLQGWLVLESASVSYGKATSYLPVIDLLKGYFKIQARDNQREIRDKVIGRGLSLDRSLEPQLPPVLELLNVPAEDPGWEALDPPQRRQRTLEAPRAGEEVKQRSRASGEPGPAYTGRGAGGEPRGPEPGPFAWPCPTP
jgi:AAA ATPase domain